MFSDANLSSDEDDSFVKFSTRKPKICQKRPVILQSDSDDDDVISLDTIKKKFGSVLKKDSRRKTSSSEEEKDESKNAYDLDDSFLVEGEGVSILDDSGDEDDEESGTDEEDSTSKQS